MYKYNMQISDFIKNNSITYDDYQLLLASINCYIDKIEFNLKNSKYYFFGDFERSFYKKDLSKLKELREKIYSFDINSVDYEIIE